ncbi:MAG: fumarylacetoacetate hydrolase family protein, partial [Nitrososphaerales archaeon]
MKLVTFVEPYYKQERIGFLYDNKVVDLTLAYAKLLRDRGETQPYLLASTIVPPCMLSMLRGGERSLNAVKEAGSYVAEKLNKGQQVCGPCDEPMVFDLSTVKIKAPIRPGKIIHTAGNFREHAKEGGQAGWEFPIPPWISFLKAPSAIIGPDEPIIYPKLTKKLDHEIEMAIVIGKGGRYITE